MTECIASFFFSLLLTTFSMPFFIKFMHFLQKQGQPIREKGPQSHFAKQGTPTMGGVLILTVILLTSFLFAQMDNPFVLLTLFVMTGFGLIGFEDDFYKLKRHSSNSGITGKQRLFWEFLIGGIAVSVALYFLPATFATRVYIPLWHYWFPLYFLYVAFGAFLLAGTTNAVNLTDGLDGLVSLPLIIVLLCLCFFGFICANPPLNTLLHLRYIPQISVICPVALAAVGALCGFLIFNHKPAEIFMGDVGALGLGGMIAMMAILTKSEIIFGIICFLFVIEALSDIIQVFFYKRTGKKVFLMAPIHHHFEKKGWSEIKVVFVFWSFALLMAVVGLVLGML